MITIAVQEEFHAAHRLLNYDGDCSCIHGHTYKIETGIKGELTKGKDGILVDFKSMKAYLRGVISFFDHCLLLNENDPLVDLLPNTAATIRTFKGNPTAEIMAKHFFKLLCTCVKSFPVVVEYVKLWETSSSFVIVTRESMEATDYALS